MRHLFSPLVFFLGIFNSFGATLPDTLTGIWQVKEVHLNTQLGRTTEYTWNDPRLTGRIFNFTRNDVTHDAYDSPDHCVNPEVRYIETSLNDLMLRSVGGYGYPPVASLDPARDYKLETSGTTQVRALSLTCAKSVWQGDLGVSYGELGKATVPGAWAVPISREEMYLRWRDETILVLRKVPHNASIEASFRCDRTSNATEHAICNSYQLAAFDQSIAQAYGRAMMQAKTSETQTVTLSRSQRQWIKHRDACGPDAACILKSMQARLEALSTTGSN
ncbi:lysozyme inhibitor LprI family protein [Paraburkholderia sp. A2WS-5]|uniref:lysozyme inhibitor LprI family protein n=1 Tax=unclassified Paraburkholderia TaxID=2615204 RepID=UPI003B79C8C8